MKATEGHMKAYQSETLTLRRSEIRMAEYNPRNITDEAARTLRKGLKKFGLVGGIVVNVRTGNTLVSGHQRVTQLDVINHYPGNDYELRVEAVDLDCKEEIELNILLNNPNAQGTWDDDKLASLVSQIDYEAAGLTMEDLAFLNVDWGDAGAVDAFGDLPDVDTFGQQQEADRYDSERRRLRDEKRRVAEKAQDEALDTRAYLCLSFSSYRAKEAFLMRFGIEPDSNYFSGEEFDEMVERI